VIYIIIKNQINRTEFKLETEDYCHVIYFMRYDNVVFLRVI